MPFLSPGYLPNPGIEPKSPALHPDDNRKKIIKITSKGKEIQKFAIKTNEEIENKLNRQIGEKEMADLKIKLEELIILIDS